MAKKKGTEKKDRMMRYIVPFSFSGEYEDVCRSLEKPESGWQNERVSGRHVYRHIYQTLNYADGVKAMQGSAWRPEQAQHISLWLDLDEANHQYANINEWGIYLFRTGIGFFWYEIYLKDTEISMELLIQYQDSLKSFGLNRRKRQLTYLASDRKRPDEAEDGYAPFYIEKWICENLQVLGKDISFYLVQGVGRSSQKKENKHEKGKVPERALLYNYFGFELENEADTVNGEEELNQKLLDYASYLTLGRNSRFLRSSEQAENAFQPFRNAYWYISDEGCGCYVCKNNQENRQYLEQNLTDDVRKDYFILYMLLLYQLYSLLHFSEKIEYELSADVRDYLEASDAYNDTLTRIQAEINTFLLKSVHTSVSQMRVQNEFYNFAKKNLRIREEIQSLTAGVDFLEELLETREDKRQQEKEKKEQNRKEEEDKRLSASLGLLSILCVLSAFTDGIGFIDQLSDAHFLDQGLLRWGHLSIIAFVCIVSIVALVYWFKGRKRKDD